MATDRIAIWEPAHSGHHLFYVRVLMQGVLDRGGEVWWIHNGPAGVSSAAQHHLSEVLQHPGAHVVCWSGPSSIASLRRLTTHLGAVRLILPDADILLAKLPTALRSRGVPISALVTRDPWLDFKNGSRRARMAGKALLCAASELSPARVDVVMMGSPYSPPKRRLLNRVADPVVFDPSTQFRGMLDADIPRDNRIWLGMAGQISERKRLDLVLEAMLLAGAHRYGLLTAGPIDEAMKQRCSPLMERVEHSGGRVVTVDRYVSNAEMSAAVAWVDALVIPHQTPNPPSTLGKALSAGTLAVVAGPDDLRQYARNFPGHAVDCALEATAISGAIRHIRARSRLEPVRLPGETEFVQGLIDPGQRVEP